MLLKIRYFGDPVLRERCKEIKEITPEIRILAQNMIETMDRNNGIGLAAPQIGESIRLFVLRNYVETPNGGWTVSEPIVFINPEIISKNNQTIIDTEACISIPKLKGHVKRPTSVTVCALDLNGNPFEEESHGYNARTRLHENDHLNGVLYIDRVDAKQKKQLEPYLRAIKKQYHPD